MRNTNPLPCTVQLLCTDRKRPHKEIRGFFQSLTDQRLFLTAPQPLPVWGAVSVEYDDVLLLGEVLTCQAEPTGLWRVLLQVEQKVNGLASLLNLRQQLLGTELTRAGFRSQGDSLAAPSRVLAQAG